MIKVLIFLVAFLLIREFFIRLMAKRCSVCGSRIYKMDKYDDKPRKQEYYCPECHLKQSKKGKHERN